MTTDSETSTDPQAGHDGSGRTSTPVRKLDGIAVAGIVLAIVVAMTVPADKLQGDVQRLMYVHVPSAWVAFLAFGVTALSSIAWLRTHKVTWDTTAAASAFVGVFFTGTALASGMIWGKPTWGVFWTWDARLVSTALLFVIYLGYLALRRATPDPIDRARRSAIMGIIAALQVAVVYKSVDWWVTLHQQSSRNSIDPALRLSLWVSVLAFTIVYIGLTSRRRALLEAEESLRLRGLRGSAVAGDAISKPNLEARSDG